MPRSMSGISQVSWLNSPYQYYSCVLSLRLSPTLFKVLFPVNGPGAAEIVHESGVAIDQLRRPSVRSVDDGALDAAFDKIVSGFCIEARRLIELGRHLQWLLERFRIVESLFDNQ